VLAVSSAHFTVGALVNIHTSVISTSHISHLALASVAPPSVDAVLLVFTGMMDTLVDVPAVPTYLFGSGWANTGVTSFVVNASVLSTISQITLVNVHTIACIIEFVTPWAEAFVFSHQILASLSLLARELHAFVHINASLAH